MKPWMAIPLTIIVSFALTFGISTWVGTQRDHTSGDQSPPARETNGLAQQNRLPPVEPLSSAPPARTSIAMISATTQAAAEAAPAPDPAEPIHAKTELPLEFLYQRSPDNRQKYEVTLMNKLEKAI